MSTYFQILYLTIGRNKNVAKIYNSISETGVNRVFSKLFIIPYFDV